MKYSESTILPEIVIYKGKKYSTGNRKDDCVELWKDKKFIKVIKISEIENLKAA